jgi:Fe-S-cluster containining protein
LAAEENHSADGPTAPGEISTGDLKEAFRRRDAYVASLDASLKEREDLIAQRMRSTNASAISKISKIYALVDELGTAAKDFVACKKGCAACCHMNVTISAIEAKHIETATGKARAALSESRTHDLAEFSGKPCPFLKDSSCSIYDVRPFACRQHVSFDTTNYWCQPERSHQKDLPKVGFNGAEEAFFNVTGRATHGIFGDIRDFFPSHPVKT